VVVIGDSRDRNDGSGSGECQVPRSWPLQEPAVVMPAGRRTDVAPHEAARLLLLPKRGTNGAGLRHVDKSGLLADPAGGTLSFGCGGGDDAMRALIALARQRSAVDHAVRDGMRTARADTPLSRNGGRPRTRGIKIGAW
jgi:hypothetical protein